MSEAAEFLEERPERRAPTHAGATGLAIAVLVPCYNEEATIAIVVGDFRAALPHAVIYVYDNNSTDRTIGRAEAAGAIVLRERLQGKGHVVRRMFADIDADLYILVDGDATYEAEAAPAMIDLLLREQLDLVNGTRVTDSVGAYRPGHRFGNAVLTAFVRGTFGAGITDMLSGYKILSRRFVKSIPLLSAGFEIETELAVHALSLSMPIGEMQTRYKDRPPGSASKLNTYRDGIRIVNAIILLIKEERPLSFFSVIAFALALLSIALAVPLVITYVETGLVPRFPTAVLSASIMLVSLLGLTCGLILDTVTRGRKESKRLAYLAAGSVLRDPDKARIAGP